MTPAQLHKYRAEWHRAWKALRAAGHHTNESADTVRKRWHLYIGAVNLRGPEAGQPKSSLILNNAEFDRFLKRCAAAHSSDDLLRQLDLDAQPMHRLRHATNPIFDRINFDKSDTAREAYLRGIHANLQRPAAANGEQTYPIEEMPGDEDLQAIVIALAHTAKHKLGEAHTHRPNGHSSRFTVHDSQAADVSSEATDLASTMARERQTVNCEPGTVNRAEGAEDDYPF
jgi:hypothetical protein